MNLYVVGGVTLLMLIEVCYQTLWDEEGIIVEDVCPEKALDMRTKNPLYRGQRTDFTTQIMEYKY